MITSTEVRRAREVVARSGVGAYLEPMLRPVQQGRKRRLSTEAFFVGMLLTVKHRKSLTLTNVHEVLTRDISASQQQELGYRRRGDAQGPCLTIRQVRYLLSAIAERLDEADRSRVEDATDEAAAGGTRPQDRVALQSVLDLFLAGTMPQHHVHNGAYAVDETGLWAWGRGRRSDAPDSDAGSDASGAKSTTAAGDSPSDRKRFDPDARWGYKTGKQGETEMYFGYGVFAFTRIRAQGTELDTVPLLTERIVVRPAATDVVEPALTEIDRLRAENRSVTEIVADRAWSFKATDRWARELRARGIEQTLDLHKLDGGAKPHEGMAMMAGVPHCPFTPEETRHLKVPSRSAPEATQEQFAEAIELRQAFAFRKVANANKSGGERWQCPAVAGKVRCSRNAMSLHLPLERPAVAVPASAQPLPSPKCCTQSSVTVPVDVGLKLRQKHYWGSPEWRAAYARRTYVEGVFGNWKNRNTENVTRGWTQVVGLVKTSLMVAVVAAASNIRLLRIWAARTGDFGDPVSAPEPQFLGFEELTSEQVEPVAGADPPAQG